MGICFFQLKEIPRKFLDLQKKANRENSSAFVLQGTVKEEVCILRRSRSGSPQLLPGTILNISGSNQRKLELPLWASVCYLDLFHASLGKICPRLNASSLYSILAKKGFIGTLCFQ